MRRTVRGARPFVNGFVAIDANVPGVYISPFVIAFTEKGVSTSRVEEEIQAARFLRDVGVVSRKGAKPQSFNP
jgi:hypothetical protein